MDFQHLSGLASAYAEARIIHTAVELRVFDAIGEKHLPAAEISSFLHTDRLATELLLNSLVALTLLEKRDELFSVAEAAKNFLVSTSPTSLCGMIRFDAALWDCWGKLAASIRSGQPARAPNMYQVDANETTAFIEAMDSLVNARGDAEVLAELLDWHTVKSLIDIGSGPATYPIHLCRRFPNLRAAIFDLPATLKITERFVRDARLADRIKLIAGDYRHDSIPGSYDLIFLSNIIHGENYEKNAVLMGKLAPHLNPGGRIVIKDHILDDSRAHPAVGAIFSMLMLLTTDGGRCYSFAEISSWMEQAGLRDIQEIVLPSPMTSSLVVGVK